MLPRCRLRVHKLHGYSQAISSGAADESFARATDPSLICLIGVVHNACAMSNRTIDFQNVPKRYSEPGCGSSLQYLLDRSIRLGQRRVALQRILMIEASGGEVSQAARDFCQSIRMTLPQREIDRMRQAARAWAEMTGCRIWQL
jgi:hypothetical protein